MCLSARHRGTFNIMHRYRTHTCGVLRESDIGEDVRLSGWCHRIRDHGGLLFIDLRDHYGITQVVADPDSLGLQGGGEAALGVGGAHRRQGAQASAGTENPELPTGDVEIYISEIEVLGPAGELPMPVFGEQEYPGGHPAEISFPRPPARAAPPQHHDARRSDRFDPAAHEGAGLLRVPDPDPDGVLARRRARLSGAVAAASGKILRAAAGAAAVQAADHGRRASIATSRSRPASATRTRAPTARPASSISSTSR